MFLFYANMYNETFVNDFQPLCNSRLLFYRSHVSWLMRGKKFWREIEKKKTFLHNVNLWPIILCTSIYLPLANHCCSTVAKQFGFFIWKDIFLPDGKSRRKVRVTAMSCATVEVAEFLSLLLPSLMMLLSLSIWRGWKKALEAKKKEAAACWQWVNNSHINQLK